MKFKSKLILSRVIKRYKRFLVDAYLDENSSDQAQNIVTAHTANTGSMKTCIGESWQAALSFHDDPKRKLKYSLELTRNGPDWIGVNTSITNKLAKEAIENGVIKELQGYTSIKSEVVTGQSRIDFLLDFGNEICYVEVKNVSMKSHGTLAEFPDAVTERGLKHLHELMALKEKGHRACMLYIVQRNDVDSFRPAFEIDPKYSSALFEAISKGVEVLIYKCIVNLEEITVYKRVVLIN